MTRFFLNHIYSSRSLRKSTKTFPKSRLDPPTPYLKLEFQKKWVKKYKFGEFLCFGEFINFLLWCFLYIFWWIHYVDFGEFISCLFWWIYLFFTLVIFFYLFWWMRLFIPVNSFIYFASQNQNDKIKNNKILVRKTKLGGTPN